jgi:simple sugar transport system permease protein
VEPVRTQGPLAAKPRPLLLNASLAVVRQLGGLAALVLIGIVVSPHDTRGGNIFMSDSNLFDILARVSNVGLLAVGMTLVVLTAGIDLSVGSVLSLGTVVAAMLLLERGWNPASILAAPCLALGAGLAAAALAGRAAAGGGRTAAARAGTLAFIIAAPLAGFGFASLLATGLPVPVILLAVMSVGLVVGCVNGLLVAYGGLQPFIATLSTMIGVWGLAWLVTGENNARRRIASDAAYAGFNWLGSRVGGVIPVPGLVLIAIVIAVHLIIRYTSVGRRLYAIGGSEEATRLSGVPVDRTKVLVYGCSGLLAALAGTLWAAQYHQGYPDAGLTKELDAIAAVVIGGTSLMGGRGGVTGTLTGVLMFGVLSNILQLKEFTTSWQRFATGGIIALAVLIQQGQVQALVKRYLVTLRGDKGR